MAELSADDLDQFLAVCVRTRRTTGFLGGQIIASWLRQQEGAGRSPKVEEKLPE